MKKALLLLVVFSFVLSRSACAASYLWTDLFALEYSDEWVWVSEDQGENKLVSFYDEDINDLNITLSVVQDDSLGLIALRDASDEALQEYADYVIANFPDADIVWKTTVKTDADQLPFLLFDGVGPMGSYLYAESPINGSVVSFTAYAYADPSFTSNRALDADDQAVLEHMIQSLQLIK